MTSVVLYGVTFTDTDFEDYGYLTPVTVDGTSYPRWQALMVAAKLQQAAGFAPSTVAVSGTTKTLALSDKNTIQECSNASAQTITVPANAAVAFDVGTVIIFEQHGAGQVTIDGDTGVTVNGVSGGSVAIDAQYRSAMIRKTATNTWIAIGALA